MREIDVKAIGDAVYKLAEEAAFELPEDFLAHETMLLWYLDL